MNPQTDIDAANDACTDHRKDMSAEEIKIFTDHVTSMQPCVLADVFRMWNLEHPRTTASALAALAPPAPKPKVGRPKAVPQRPAGTPDIRGFFSIKKRDRDDDDHGDEIQNLRPGEK